MYDEIPRRENFLSFSAKTFFLQKTWHHLSTWDAPHIWLHHGVHLLADMKAAISDNVPPKSYGSKVLQSIEHSQVTCWIWDQNLMISYCTSDIGIFPLRFLSALRRNKYIARYIR